MMGVGEGGLVTLHMPAGVTWTCCCMMAQCHAGLRCMGPHFPTVPGPSPGPARRPPSPPRQCPGPGWLRRSQWPASAQAAQQQLAILQPPLVAQQLGVKTEFVGQPAVGLEQLCQAQGAELSPLSHFLPGDGGVRSHPLWSTAGDRHLAQCDLVTSYLLLSVNTILRLPSQHDYLATEQTQKVADGPCTHDFICVIVLTRGSSVGRSFAEQALVGTPSDLDHSLPDLKADTSPPRSDLACQAPAGRSWTQAATPGRSRRARPGSANTVSSGSRAPTEAYRWSSDCVVAGAGLLDVSDANSRTSRPGAGCDEGGPELTAPEAGPLFSLFGVMQQSVLGTGALGCVGNAELVPHPNAACCAGCDVVWTDSFVRVDACPRQLHRSMSNASSKIM
ncbi:hypothetical protein HaLaN_12613 [Haematococcus lacustris]|uniref:Uncharacterized protein n=1 Tax=Haematococcus lacustris TaxID=44745 RepID=A0A699ZKD6_HAELA|nr:hypothetical protein HaLaN_12613 [Haematococcus lacustris]